MKKVYRQFRNLFGGRLRITIVSCISILAIMLLQVAGASAISRHPAPSPNVNTTYYGCVNYNTGKIYIIQQNGKCKLGYTMIQWNQVGPQGPQGPQGPAGVSQGYFYSNGNVNISNGNLTTVVMTNPVVAGNYLVTATEVANIDTGDTVACIVGSVIGGVQGHYYGTAGPVSNRQYSTITFSDSIVAATGDQIELFCIDYNKDSNTISYNAAISAIQLNAVGSNNVHTQHKPAPPALPRH